MIDHADPYRTLGVKPGASTEEVRKAFRSAAKECHPDLYPDDPVRADRFKQISWAHALLTNVQARRKYDNAQRTGFGTRVHPGRSPGQGGAGPSPRTERRWFPGIDGVDIDYTVTVTAAEAKSGARKTISTTNGRTLMVTIPEGARDGHVLRLRGQGMPGKFGGAAGDAMVTINVALPPGFRAEVDGVHYDLDVPLEVAVLGGKVTAPTLDGSVTITIPRASNSGDTLRLRGRGPALTGGGRSDQFVHLRIVLTRPVDQDLEDALREWSARTIAASEKG